MEKIAAYGFTIDYRLALCREVDGAIAQGKTVTEACNLVKTNHKMRYSTVREIHRTKDAHLLIQAFMNDEVVKQCVLDRYVSGDTFQEIADDIGVPMVWLSRGFFRELKDAKQYTAARVRTVRYNREALVEEVVNVFDFSGDNLEIPVRTRCNQVGYTSARVGSSALMTAEF